MRVVGSPLNSQSAVNTCAVPLIALDFKKIDIFYYIYTYIYLFFWKIPKSDFIENRTKTRGFFFRVPCITLSMFYWHDTNKKYDFRDVVSVVSSQTRNGTYIMPITPWCLSCAPECYNFQGNSWLVIFETGRDGTALTCLAGKKTQDGTGRDGKKMKNVVA